MAPTSRVSPLNTDRDIAIKIIFDAWNINCIEIQAIEIEYAPSLKENYLNDRTAFDAYLKVKLKNGNTCGIGIEVKYTEQAYPIGKTELVNVNDHDSLYWKTARASGVFKNPDDDMFGRDEFRQIWRNHLLGLKMIQLGDVDEFYSVTLFPNGNNHFHYVIPEYISQLQREARRYLIGCTFEQFISAIQGTEEFEEWKHWLDQRYLIKNL